MDIPFQDAIVNLHRAVRDVQSETTLCKDRNEQAELIHYAATLETIKDRLEELRAKAIKKAS